MPPDLPAPPATPEPKAWTQRLGRALGSPKGIAILAVVWVVGIGAGLKAALDWEITPGTAAVAPASWPAKCGVPRSIDKPVLVLFAHPRCSCTRASLNELAAIMARAGRPVAAHVLFLKPAGVGEEWERSDTWGIARNIPGVAVQVDEGGRVAKHFGARTSGQVVLYDERGRLLFSGGVTGMRGHEGDNAGRQRILSLLRTRAADKPTSPVFGCAMEDEK